MMNEFNPDGKDIRFIDSHYRDLFRIPDGGTIQVHYSDDSVVIKPCKFTKNAIINLPQRSSPRGKFFYYKNPNGGAKMSEVKRAITDAMRQRIYEMWIAGYKVANIAADLGVNAHTVKSELERGYTGDIYIGGRKVYDPDRASAIAKMVKAGRPPVRIVPPVVLGKEPHHD